MDPSVVYALVPIAGAVFGGPTVVVLGLLLFPSTRAALARRLAGRGAGPLDDQGAAHSASTDANVTALRSEVYALRCEVAAIPRASSSGPAGAGRPALGQWRAVGVLACRGAGSHWRHDQTPLRGKGLLTADHQKQSGAAERDKDAHEWGHA